jgi:hypothetical protein
MRKRALRIHLQFCAITKAIALSDLPWSENLEKPSATQFTAKLG